MSQLIHYTSQDQTAHCLHAFACPVSEQTTKPVVLLFPAMGVEASYYFKLAEHFNDLDIHFACTDLRGNDPMQSSASRSNNFGYHEMLEYDWPAAIKACKTHFPNAPLYLMGHSLGGQLTACYATHKPDISGLIFVASGNIYYKLFHKKFRTLFGSLALLSASKLIGYLPGKKIGFGGNESKWVIRDWAYTIRTGLFRSIHNGKRKIYNGKMGQINTPIMAISFDGDKLAPHSSTQAILDLFHSSKKHHVKTCAQELNMTSLNHFNWTQNFQKLAKKIAVWIEKNE